MPMHPRQSVASIRLLPVFNRSSQLLPGDLNEYEIDINEKEIVGVPGMIYRSVLVSLLIGRLAYLRLKTILGLISLLRTRPTGGYVRSHYNILMHIGPSLI
jgi:hypothetical protein